MSPTLRPGTFRFGDFELDARSGELIRNGRKIRLQEQPCKILMLLLERPGEVLTRDELRQKLWPADTFVAFDDGLNTAIKKLRHALDDAADSPRFVETLPRRGYRFVGTVDHPISPDPSQSALTESTTTPRVRPKRWGLVAATLAVVATGGALALGGGLGWPRLAGGANVGSIRSIAVLPLDDLSGDSSQEYFADGMTDELTTTLAKISSLRVIARSSVLPYKNARKPAPDIGRALAVDGIVEGSVMRAGNRVRITVRLSEASTARQLFAESYERELRDILSLQRDVAEAVARQVKIALTPGDEISLGHGRAVDPQAYDDYLRGKFYFRRPSETDNQAAISALERAVARDPGFALAYAELGRAYSNRGFRYAPQELHWQERAFVAVEKALALDPDLADAHLSRGVFLWTVPNHFPHVQAIQELRRAVSLNPNLAEAHQQLAAVYNHIGFLDEALMESRQAAAINPGNTAARNRIGESLLFQGRYEDALAAFADVPQEGDLTIWRHHTATALLHLGRTTEALREVEESLRVLPRDQGGLLASSEAMIAAANGDERTADEQINAAVTRGKQFGHFHHTAYAIASAYALMNRPEPALQWLQVTVDTGFPCYPLFLSDPDLNHLRRDPRFIAFMAKLKAQWEHYRAVLGS